MEDKGAASRRARIHWCPTKPFSTDKFTSYLQTSLEARQLTNGGPLQAVLAARVQTLTGCQNRVIPAASGTAALHALCAGWSLKLGRKLSWATQAFTFPPATQGPLSGSLVVDNDESLGGPCIASLSKIADSIDGVVVTNIFGLQTDVLAYESWCTDHGKLLVFDNAATSVGLTHCGRSIHDVGDGAFISLHETKPIGRGEGGAIFVRPELVEFVVRAANFGFLPPRIGMPRAGHRGCSNWRMSDVAAAAILPHLDSVIETGWVARYEAAVSFASAEAQSYGFSLEPIPGLSLRFPTVLACLLVALPISCRGKIDQVIAMLDTHAEAKHYYDPLVEPSKAPVAWQLFNSTICLPFHLDLTQDDVAFMFEKLSRAVGQVADAN